MLGSMFALFFLGFAMMVADSYGSYKDRARDRESIRADIAAQSAMQQRRYDDMVGLCEHIEAHVKAIYGGIDAMKPVTPAKPDAKKLMQVMDYETSQIAALDEFKDEK